MYIADMKSRKSLFGFYLISLVLLACVPLRLLSAEETTAAPWVTVLPPVNRSDAAHNDQVAQSMAATMELALRYLGDFRIREAATFPHVSMAVESPDQAAAYAHAADVDYLIHGTMETGVTGGYHFGIAVYDRSLPGISAAHESTAAGLFDVFDAADEIVLEILSALSGRRIVFGSLGFAPTVPGTAGYAVFVDDQFVGLDITRVDGIPGGDRSVRIVDMVAQPGTVLHRETVTVTELATAMVNFLPPAIQRSPWTPRVIAYRGNDAAVRTTPKVSGSNDRFLTGKSPEPGWDSGTNPDLLFVEYAHRRGSVAMPDVRQRGDSSWASALVRSPLVSWQIDGYFDEWPVTTQDYWFDTDLSNDTFVGVAYYRVAFTPDHVVLAFELSGDGERFIRIPDPRIKIFGMVHGDTGSSQYSFQLRHGQGRLLVLEVLQRGQDGYHQSVTAAQIGRNGPSFEVQIPRESIDNVTDYRVQSIELQERIQHQSDELIWRSDRAVSYRGER